MTLRKLTLISFAAAALTAAAQYTPQTVVEEGTGEWCKWCVKGIVAAEELTGRYPENFLVIAIHQNDEFAMNEYITDCGFLAFPQANINRIYNHYDVSTEAWETFHDEISKQNARATISLKAALDNDGNITAETTTTVGAETSQKFNIAIVLTESHLVGTYQVNAYAGGLNGEMGGYENLPERIQYPVYSHVAREIFPEYAGEPLHDGGVEGDVFTKTFTVPVPEAVKDPRNLDVIALLLGDNRIIGAQKVGLCNQKAAVASATNAEGTLTKPKEITATLNVRNPDDKENVYSFVRFVLVAEDGSETGLRPITVNLNPGEATDITMVSVTGKIKDGRYTVRVETSADGTEWVAQDTSFTIVAGNDAIADVHADDSTTTPQWFTLQGIEVSNPRPGNVYICRQGHKIVKVRL